MTWNVTTWKLKTGRLTPEERSLVDAAIARINRILGLCECGKPRAFHDRCSDCWRPTR